MLRILFRIRLRQAWHYVTELGWLRLMIVLPFVLFFLVAIGQSLWHTDGMDSVYAAIVMAFLLLSTHLNRPDKTFVKHLNISAYQLFFIEYLVLSSPLLLLFIFSGQWLPVGILLVSVACIPLLSAHISLGNFKGLQSGFRFIPATLFEWRSGLRRHIWWLLPLWLLGLWGSTYVIAVPLVLLIIAYTSCSFHLEAESLEMLRASHHSPKGLLHLKIRQHLLLYGLICLPLCIAFLVQHYSLWYLLLYFGVTSSILQIFSIVYKYSLYTPNASLQYNFILISFLGLSIINPMILFLLVVLVIMTIKRYKNATNRLSYFL